MDPISDLLTRIRNANTRQKDRVDVPYSKLKMEVVRILKDEGFIANFKTLFNPGGKSGTIRVFLKYSPTKEAVIRGIKRVSKPGLRIYRGYDDIPRARRFRRDDPLDVAGRRDGQAGAREEGRRRSPLPGLVS